MNVHRAVETSAPVLLRERDGDIAILVLNRPQARNSLSEALLIALSEALSEIAADKSVRASVRTFNHASFAVKKHLATARSHHPHFHAAGGK